MKLIAVVLSLTLYQALSADPEPSDDANLKSYLEMYNFLPTSYTELGRTPTQAEVEGALKDFQFMAALPESGLLDEQTAQIISTRRCDITDDVDRVRSRTTNPNHSLGKRNLVYEVKRSNEDNPSLLDMIRIIEQAVALWQNNTGLTFTSLLYSPLDSGDVEFSFERNYHKDRIPFYPDGNMLTHAFKPGDLHQGQVHFNGYARWDTSDDSTVEDGAVRFLSVAAHSVGHAVGLLHSNDPESVMYPWFEPHRQPSLSEEDRLQLTDIYSKDERGADNGTTTLAPAPAADKCPSSVDAVFLSRNRIFFFKDQDYWLVHERSDSYNEKEMSINNFWYGLPEGITKIDAAYENPKSGSTVFFIGQRYYKFHGNRIPASYPSQGRPITEFHLPHSLKKIDAAFVWGRNRMTYFISGDMYWKYDDFEGKPFDGYPKDMRLWKGVKLPVDAAFTSFDDKVYFLHSSQYWRLDDWTMSVEQGYPKSLNELLRCSDAGHVTGNGRRTSANPRNSGFSHGHSVSTIITVWSFCVCFVSIK